MVQIEHYVTKYCNIMYYLYFYNKTLQTIMTKQRTKMFIACRGLNCLIYVIYTYIYIYTLYYSYVFENIYIYI